MSDHFQMLVDPEVSEGDAEFLCSHVVAELRDRGLITGPLTSECVLGEVGYCPGPRLPESYVPAETEGLFWKLKTSGVEPHVGRQFNYWALGPVCEGLTCPQCRGRVDFADGEFGDSLGKAIDEWLKRSGTAIVSCPDCKSPVSVTDWQCRPPLGFGNLSFRFWNWPPFDGPGWQIDLVELFRKITGHKVVVTWGHL